MDSHFYENCWAVGIDSSQQVEANRKLKTTLFSFVLINIMQEGLIGSASRIPQARISDKLENIYSEQSYIHRNDEQLRKRLFSQIIQQSNERIRQKQKMERQLNRAQNQQIDLFWRNQQERLRALQRKRKMDIQEARKVNNSQFQQRLNQSMNVEQYHLQKSFRDDLSAFEANERRKKQERQQFYREGMMLQQARKDRKRFDREIDIIIDHKKQKQDKQLQQKRSEFYSNWKQKHFQEKHPQVIKMFDQLNTKKEIDSSRLEDMIAVKGGVQLNQRVAAQRMAQIQENAAKKDKHLAILKNQVEENTYKAAIDRYLEQNYERNKMHQRAKVIAERDQIEREYKKELNNEHLGILRGQMKPRNLLPDPDKIQAAGIGSPAHIGKIVHDDRLKQLKWIQRNFLQQIKQI